MVAAVGVRGASAMCSCPAMCTRICWIGRRVLTIFLMLSPLASEVSGDREGGEHGGQVGFDRVAGVVEDQPGAWVALAHPEGRFDVPQRVVAGDDLTAGITSASMLVTYPLSPTRRSALSWDASSRTRLPPVVLTNRGAREAISPAMTAFARLACNVSVVQSRATRFSNRPTSLATNPNARPGPRPVQRAARRRSRRGQHAWPSSE